MTIYGEGPLLAPDDQPIGEQTTSTGEYIKNQFLGGIEDGPIANIFRAIQDSRAKGVESGGKRYDPWSGDEIPDEPVPIEEARKKVKDAGLEHHLDLGTAQSIQRPALDLMMNHARDRAYREAQIARGPSGIIPGTAGVAANFFSSALDPLAMAAFAIPVVGEAKGAAMMAAAGSSIFARAGVRAGVGAAQGAIGSTALTPFEAWAHTQDGRDYGMAEALQSVIMGAGFAGSMHVLGGGVSDVWRSLRGKPLYPFAPGEEHARVPPPPARTFPETDALLSHEGLMSSSRPEAGFSIEDIIKTPRVTDAIEDPLLERGHDVPYGVGLSDHHPTGTHVDRNIPEEVEINGVKFDPAVPVSIARHVEREATDRMFSQFRDNNGRAPNDREIEQILKYAKQNFGIPVARAWLDNHKIPHAEFEKRWGELIKGIDHEEPATPPPGMDTTPLPPRVREKLGGKTPGAEETSRIEPPIESENPALAEEAEPPIKPALEVPRPEREPDIVNPATGTQDILAPTETAEILKGAIANLIQGKPVQAAKVIEATRPEPAVDTIALHVANLKAAGTDSVAYGQAMADIKKLSKDEVNAIQHAYIGGREAWATKKEAIAAIHKFFAEKHYQETKMVQVDKATEAMLQDSGIQESDLGSARVARVIEIMQKEGVSDPEIAFERAVMEEEHADVEAGKATPPTEHIPGWDDAPNDDSGPAPEAGGPTPQGEPPEGQGTGGPPRLGGEDTGPAGTETGEPAAGGSPDTGPGPAGDSRRIVERIAGPDGMEVLIVRNADGKNFNVVMRDTDADETVPHILIVPSIERAREVANEWLGIKPEPDEVTDAVSAFLSDHFKDYFLGTNHFRTIVEARKFAKEKGFDLDNKQIEEAIEFGAVKAAREIVSRMGTSQEKFKALVDMYGRQPILGTRTSTSMRDQAFSTPVPLAYVASRLAHVEPRLNVYEPSAGNGALLMEVDHPNYGLANELNPTRAGNLREQGFRVTEHDASDPAQGRTLRQEGGVDVVLANPPFGAVKEGTKSKVFNLSDIQEGYSTHEIDHAIVLRALEGMKDDGRAVLLIGSVNKLARDKAPSAGILEEIRGMSARDAIEAATQFTGLVPEKTKAAAIASVEKKLLRDKRFANKIGEQIPAIESPTIDRSRSDAYNSKAKREFFKVLYDRYNVSDIFTVAGELYARQGAGWPIDVIVIDGRGKSSLKLPAANPPREYDSWEALGGVLDGLDGKSKVSPGNEPGGDVRAPIPFGTGGSDERVRTPVGGSGIPDRESAQGDTGTVRPRPVSGQSGDIRPGGERQEAGEGLATGGQRSEPGGTDSISNAERPPQRLEETSADKAEEAVKEALDPEPPPQRRPPKKAEVETASQVSYTPQSVRGDGLGTLVPINMRKSISDSLEGVAKRNGDIDHFVAKELGYDINELHKFLAAEQIDAVALAIDNIKRGKGFIIGDQTGIGKGRVNASIIRWAINTKRIPIFVTEKPGLYGDMYRDLSDVGIQGMLGREPRFLMTNASQDVAISKDINLKTGSATAHNTLLERTPKDPEGFFQNYDVILTTYDQMNATEGAETARRGFLRAIAGNAIVLFDESHNAGGQAAARAAQKVGQDRSTFARDLVQAARGVFYSSATYAKRPDVMDLYSKTDMSMAVADPKDLGPAIAAGGVPMQQAVASMLARAGQYMRRERSFHGVEYNTPIVPVDRATYDGVSRSLGAIQDFSEAIKSVIDEIDSQIKEDAASISIDGSTGGAGASSTNFTSIMHNIVNQYLLATKAKPAARMAIEALERGEKPVITVSGTMESFLNGYIAEMDLKPGDAIGASFGDVLVKYLDRTRTLTIKKPFSKEPGTKKYLTDAELGPMGRAAYARAKKMIHALDLSDVPVSPIDAIKGELTKAGYRVGEITGRGTTIDYSSKHPTISARPTSETSTRGRRSTIDRFNGDKVPKEEWLDAMILNQAGATGLSLHAGEKFGDQRQRHMFIAQPEANIDTHMQLLGRIHRTGQVVLPKYSQLTADIPAEKRPTAVLAKKMASLNANTTAARGSAMTAKDSVDFLNQYGDMVAASMIAEDPELNSKLGGALKYKEGGGVDPLDSMRKVTGRIPLLPLKDQEALYARLEEDYNSLLEQMKAAGENSLEAQSMDLGAKTLETRQVVPQKNNSGSPFAAPVNMEKVSVKRTGKPYKGHEVVSKALEGAGITDVTVTPENASKLLKDMSLEQDTPLAKRIYQNHQEQVGDAIKRFETYKRSVIDEIEKPARQEAERVKLDGVKDRFNQIHELSRPGEAVVLKTTSGNMVGVVLKVEQKGSPKNPLAMSTWKVRIAISDATREITLPFSRLFGEGRAPNDDEFAIEIGHVSSWLESRKDTLDRFDKQQSDAREERYIATGNMLAAYDWLKRRGRIINYTDDAGHTRQGVLTSRDFDLDEFAKENKTAIGDETAVMDWLKNNEYRDLSTQDGVVTVNLRGGVATVSISGAKRVGGVYFLDKDLTNLTGDFRRQGGNKMVARVVDYKLQDTIKRLQELGASFATVKDLPPAQEVKAPKPKPEPKKAWEDLAKEPLPHEDPEFQARSREAELAPEPDSVAEPAKALKAAEKAEQAAKEQIMNAGYYMTEGQRAALDRVLQEADQEAVSRAETIRQGIACLAAGGFGKEA